MMDGTDEEMIEIHRTWFNLSCVRDWKAFVGGGHKHGCKWAFQLWSSLSSSSNSFKPKGCHLISVEETFQNDGACTPGSIAAGIGFGLKTQALPIQNSLCGAFKIFCLRVWACPLHSQRSRIADRCFNDWGSDLFAVRWFPSPSDSLEQLVLTGLQAPQWKQNETNIPLTTKKVPISRTCPRLCGSFVGSPWTLNRYRMLSIPSIPTAWKACRTCLELLWDTWLLVPSTRFALSASAPIQPEPGVAGLLDGHNCFPEPHLGC